MLICFFFYRILCLKMHCILLGFLIQILHDYVLWPIANKFVGDLTFSSFYITVQVYRGKTIISFSCPLEQNIVDHQEDENTRRRTRYKV